MSHPYEKLSPDAALAEAANLLSRTNLDQTWMLVSLLSLMDSLPQSNDDHLLLFPMLNLEKVRLLSAAVLASKSLSYKTQDLSPNQFTALLNYVNAALGDVESLEAKRPLNDMGGSDLFFRFFFANLGNVQIHYQDIRFQERVGRLIAMFETLPRTHRSRMSDGFWVRADPALAAIQDFLGGQPIHLYAVCTHVFWYMCAPVYSEVLGRLKQAHAESASQVNLIQYLFSLCKVYGPRLALTVEMQPPPDLVTPYRDIIPRFMRIFARTTRELRDLMQTDKAYRQGTIAHRLSPLDRYPVVWLDKHRAIVPNYRFLYRNITDIMHFALREAVTWYDELRGGLQELYLHALLEAKLPAVIIIPERAYRRGKESVRGPDLILVEGDHLLLVESKARRFTVETRFSMTPQLLLSNLKGAIDSIVALQDKHAELSKGLPEYHNVQAVLDRARDTAPLFLSIVGNEVSMMGEMLRGLEQHDPDFPLRGFKHQWDILGIDGFERAVEFAASSKRTLRAVIEEHIARSKVVEHGTPAADLFGTIEPDMDSFAVSFFRRSLDDHRGAT